MTNPVVTIKMAAGGIIKGELRPDVAPNTVNNFIHLAQNGFYNGIIFHRVIPDFMIQGGDPTGTGMGGPDYCIRGEFSQNGHANSLKHQKGVFSMARAQNPDSAGSQFFITVADTPFLDGQYATFGVVTEGMEEAVRISLVERNRQDKPLTDETIESVTVETFGEEYPAPIKR
ncbi:putative bifunctional phosphatase/peptidyl-prolyl cis-trans isomerase [bioreactor metagenome]|uniref:peptidylprolyl isomerase n=1 Tax=bioreactor metagenome TaxID=1076179 RepID=A0A645FMU4_9ZZZZ